VAESMCMLLYSGLHENFIPKVDGSKPLCEKEKTKTTLKFWQWDSDMGPGLLLVSDLIVATQEAYCDSNGNMEVLRQ
jgi:hypothetical protein